MNKFSIRKKKNNNKKNLNYNRREYKRNKNMKWKYLIINKI